MVAVLRTYARPSGALGDEPNVTEVPTDSCDVNCFARGALPWGIGAGLLTAGIAALLGSKHPLRWGAGGAVVGSGFGFVGCSAVVGACKATEGAFGP